MFAVLQSKVTSCIVGVPWLQERLGQVVVLQCGMGVPHDVFAGAHVPTAQLWDIQQGGGAAKTLGCALPHARMLPSSDAFAARASKLGVSATTTVVLYDAAQTLHVAPRVWWMFRVMGLDDVKILHGGLPAWLQAGLSIETGDAHPPRGGATALHVKGVRDNLIVDYAAVVRGVADKSLTLVDARSPELYGAASSTPMRRSHIPGALNVPAASLLRDGALASREQISATLRDAGVLSALKSGARVATYSTTGVSAATVNLAMAEIGYPNVALYDGSFAEYDSKQ